MTFNYDLDLISVRCVMGFANTRTEANILAKFDINHFMGKGDMEHTSN